MRKCLHCSGVIAIGVGCLLLAATATRAAKRIPLDRSNEEMVRASILEVVAFARANGRFAQLENLAGTFREWRRRTPSGIWELTAFYGSLPAFLPNWSAKGYYGPPRAQWDAQTEAWIKGYPNAPEAYLFKAYQLHIEAWRIRGSGYAKDVWPDAWKGFYEKMRAAAKVLDDAKPIASRDPHWYTLRIKVAMALGEGQLKILGLLQEAVRREPYYYETYFAALWALRKEWGGSFALMDALVDWSVRQTAEKDGTSMFARMYWTLYGEPYMIKKYADRKVFWPRMKRALQDLFARYPNVFNVNAHLWTACASRNYAAAKFLLVERKRIGGKPLAHLSEDPNVVCKDVKVPNK